MVMEFRLVTQSGVRVQVILAIHDEGSHAGQLCILRRSCRDLHDVRDGAERVDKGGRKWGGWQRVGKSDLGRHVRFHFSNRSAS